MDEQIPSATQWSETKIKCIGCFDKLSNRKPKTGNWKPKNLLM